MIERRTKMLNLWTEVDSGDILECNVVRNVILLAVNFQCKIFSRKWLKLKGINDSIPTAWEVSKIF